MGFIWTCPNIIAASCNSTSWFSFLGTVGKMWSLSNKSFPLKRETAIEDNFHKAWKVNCFGKQMDEKKQPFLTIYG